MFCAREAKVLRHTNKKPAGLHWRVFLIPAGRAGQADKKG
jgi:hypothetical protein